MSAKWELCHDLAAFAAEQRFNGTDNSNWLAYLEKQYTIKSNHDTQFPLP
jgi:hypothetical protein